MENELVQYIIDAQKHGLTELEIKQNLLNAGWEASTVEQGFAFAKAAESKPANNKADDLKTAKLDFEASLRVVNKSATAFSVSPAPSVAVSDTNLASPSPGSPNSSGRGKLAAVIVLVILIIGAGAYAAYAYFYNNPTRIWQQILAAKQPDVYSGSYKISYSDNSSASSTQHILFQLSGTDYIDSHNASSAAASLDINLQASANGQSLNHDLQILLLDKILYFNLGKIPQLDKTLGKPLGWIKLDLGQLKGLASSTPVSSDYADLKKQYGDGLRQIWLENNPIITKKIVRENLAGEPVYHLYLDIDKNKLQNAIGKSLDLTEQVSKQDVNYQQNLIDSQYAGVKTAINGLVNKLQVKQFELWVGRSDYILRRVFFVSNAPSQGSNLGSLKNLTPLGPARAKSRDAQRLSDIRQISSALELYREDYGGYPSANNGVPQGDFSPKYISSIPNAPQPADGACTDYYNAYWYTPVGTPKQSKGQLVYPDYQYTFCLGGDTGDYNAGIVKASSQGFSNVTSCPEQDVSKCYKSGAAASAANNLESIPFNGEFTIDVSYTDIGKQKQLTSPTDALDLSQLLSGFIGMVPKQGTSTPNTNIP